MYQVLRATSLLVQYYCCTTDFVSLCNKIWSTHVLCGVTAVLVLVLTVVDTNLLLQG